MDSRLVVCDEEVSGDWRDREVSFEMLPLLDAVEKLAWRSCLVMTMVVAVS